MSEHPAEPAEEAERAAAPVAQPSAHDGAGPDETGAWSAVADDTSAPDDDLEDAGTDEAWPGDDATATGSGAPQDDRDDAIAPAVQPSVGDDEQDELAAARRRLAEVTDLPVEEHAAVYQDVHRRLQDALADAGREREPGEGAADGGAAPDDGAPDR